MYCISAIIVSSILKMGITETFTGQQKRKMHPTIMAKHTRFQRQLGMKVGNIGPSLTLRLYILKVIGITAPCGLDRQMMQMAARS